MWHEPENEARISAGFGQAFEGIIAAKAWSPWGIIRICVLYLVAVHIYTGVKGMLEAWEAAGLEGHAWLYYEICKDLVSPFDAAGKENPLKLTLHRGMKSKKLLSPSHTEQGI